MNGVGSFNRQDAKDAKRRNRGEQRRTEEKRGVIGSCRGRG
jgi:hypothetical protein